MRLKRPGYWIVAAVIVISVSMNRKSPDSDMSRVTDNRVEEIVDRAKGFADRVIEELKDRKLFNLHSEFSPDKSRQIGIDDIALFVDTLQIDGIQESRWKNYSVSDREVVLIGSLVTDDNDTYPLGMVLKENNGSITLEAIRIKRKNIVAREKEFPLNSYEKIEASGDYGPSTERVENETNLSAGGVVSDMGADDSPPAKENR